MAVIMSVSVLPTDQLYREQLLDHYRQPRNYGKLLKYNAEATGQNPLCGDVVQVQLQLQDGSITKIGFISQGCVISTAAGSLLSEQMTGCSIADVLELRLTDVEKLLGVRLPLPRIKCGLLFLEAVQAALQ